MHCVRSFWIATGQGQCGHGGSRRIRRKSRLRAVGRPGVVLLAEKVEAVVGEVVKTGMRMAVAGKVVAARAMSGAVPELGRVEQAVRRVCWELDGRVAMALEEGFEAKAQGREDPYANERPSKFCARFAQGLRRAPPAPASAAPNLDAEVAAAPAAAAVPAAAPAAEPPAEPAAAPAA